MKIPSLKLPIPSLLLCALCACGGNSTVEPEPNEPEPQEPIPQEPVPQEPYLPTPLAATVVEPSAQFQTHEGFGTSLAWFGNVIGGWPDTTRNAIADLLFDPTQGLGLNIVRYNIGGGENPNHDHMRAGGEMEGFQPSEGNWDWSADPRQRWMLSAAKQRAGNTFIAEAFSNSPPYWMTYSQCAAGNDNGANDALRSDRYDDFANYLAEVAVHFSNEWGIDFRTVEPVNEPEADWWRAFNGQEGAHFSPASQARIVDELANAASTKSLDIEIAAMDAAGIGAAVDNYNSYSAETRANINQINAHGYHRSDREMAELRLIGAKENKRIWMSESDGGGLEDAFAANTHNPDAMGPALDLSWRIYRVLKQLQPDGWVFWQAVENWPNQIDIRKNWGLILADFGASGNSSNHYRTTKKYYTMAQYSKHIRPGDRMIYINDPSAVAFLNEENKTLSVVKTNTTTQSQLFELDLSRFHQLPSEVEVYRTSTSQNYQKLSNVNINSSVLTATLPGQSITTYVVKEVDYQQAPKIKGQFNIVNKNSGLCLTLLSDTPTNIVQQACNDGNAQQWQIDFDANGFYTIQNIANTQLLSLEQNSLDSASHLTTQALSQSATHAWYLLDQGDGYFHIMNQHSGLIVDVNGASQNNNAEVLQWFDNGGNNQDWELILL